MQVAHASDVKGSSPVADAGSARLETKVLGVTYSGGIVGLFANRRLMLQAVIQGQNDQGFRLRHALPSKSGLFFIILQLFCLLVTFALWSPEPGETLVFERGR